MGRNDKYHHHKSSQNKHSGSKHHRQHQQHQQHQQHGSSNQYQANGPEPFDTQCLPSPFQVPSFIQPPPMVPQFNPSYQQQAMEQAIQQAAQLNQQQQQQQLFFNQLQQPLLTPSTADLTRSLLMQNNTPLPQQPWFVQNPRNMLYNTPQPVSAISSEQSISAEALNRLQLPASQITDTGIIPNTPYYELPAGLMVPLVPHSQIKYKPLNPADLRLPLPKFPDENFLKSIDAYYGSDGKTRDSVGWDREFIDTFISQKEALASS